MKTRPTTYQFFLIRKVFGLDFGLDFSRKLLYLRFMRKLLYLAM